jgi:hypothetical protein
VKSQGAAEQLDITYVIKRSLRSKFGKNFAGISLLIAVRRGFPKEKAQRPDERSEESREGSLQFLTNN